VQSQTRDAVNAVKSIEVKINAVNEASSSIATAIEEQNSATAEISRTTQISSRNMQELDSSVSSVNEASEITGQAANDVLGAASELSLQTNKLETTVKTFLADVNGL